MWSDVAQTSQDKQLQHEWPQLYANFFQEQQWSNELSLLTKMGHHRHNHSSIGTTALQAKSSCYDPETSREPTAQNINVSLYFREQDGKAYSKLTDQVFRDYTTRSTYSTHNTCTSRWYQEHYMLLMVPARHLVLILLIPLPDLLQLYIYTNPPRLSYASNYNITEKGTGYRIIFFGPSITTRCYYTFWLNYDRT